MRTILIFILGIFLLLPISYAQETLKATGNTILISKMLNKTTSIEFGKIIMMKKHPDGSGYPIKEEYYSESELFAVEIEYSGIMAGSVSKELLLNDTFNSYIDVDFDGIPDFGIKLLKYEKPYIYFNATDLSQPIFKEKDNYMLYWWITVMLIISIVITIGLWDYYKGKKDQTIQ